MPAFAILGVHNFYLTFSNPNLFPIIFFKFSYSEFINSNIFTGIFFRNYLINTTDKAPTRF